MRRVPPLTSDTAVLARADAQTASASCLPIYLDYHATTPTDRRVAEVVLHYMTDVFGNASSSDHAFGDEADLAVTVATEQVADLIGANPRDVVFTSGATESINLGIQGLVRAAHRTGRRRPLQIGLMPVEHRAVLDTCVALADRGEVQIVFFRVDTSAQLDLDDFESKCRTGLDLACVMAANNEVGTLYPIRRAAAIARDNGALILTDATQAAGKHPLSFTDWNIDLLALSAHKMYGPKGVGALVLSPQIRLEPLLYGGAHQRRLRSGTLNVPGIAGLGEACRLRQLEMAVDEPRIAKQRDRLQKVLEQQIPELLVNGDRGRRLAGNLHVSVPGLPGRAIVAHLRERVAVSTGSACSSGIEAPSHVLRAMGLSQDVQEGAIRLGMGKFTADDEIERAAEQIVSTVNKVRLKL